MRVCTCEPPRARSASSWRRLWATGVATATPAPLPLASHRANAGAPGKDERPAGLPGTAPLAPPSADVNVLDWTNGGAAAIVPAPVICTTITTSVDPAGDNSGIRAQRRLCAPICTEGYALYPHTEGYALHPHMEGDALHPRTAGYALHPRTEGFAHPDAALALRHTAAGTFAVDRSEGKRPSGAVRKRKECVPVEGRMDAASGGGDKRGNLTGAPSANRDGAGDRERRWKLRFREWAAGTSPPRGYTRDFSCRTVAPHVAATTSEIGCGEAEEDAREWIAVGRLLARTESAVADAWLSPSTLGVAGRGPPGPR